jgi:catechol 2,3-dioxygenase-like lactoylglutathione lyase family enzyme
LTDPDQLTYCRLIEFKRSRAERKEDRMAKLRHIAVHTADPDKTADFYKRVFEMVEVGRTDSPIARGIYLSDGTINMAVLRFKTVEAADRQDGLGPVFGLHHFGFWVDDMEETRRRLREAGAEYRFGRPEAATTSFFEEKYKGPDAVMIDITPHGWIGAAPPAEKVSAKAEADPKTASA